ncbi:MAG: cupredoxin domain-containing protein [Longimicrobiales bacterium]
MNESNDGLFARHRPETGARSVLHSVPDARQRHGPTNLPGRATRIQHALVQVSLATALAAAASSAAAQSLLDRPPNLGGTWVGDPGVVHFNFLHRFTSSDPPLRKVTNGPTFLLAASLPGQTLFGFRYATASQVVESVPNEWEFFGRWNPVTEASGAPLDMSLHAGWNHAAESFDGEVTLARRFGALRLLAVGRGFSNAFNNDDSRFALGAGATFAISSNVALAADVSTLLDREDEEDIAWGAGLHLRIPYTPHTFSLQVTNTNSATLQGSSIDAGITRYGFEFTIPFTLARYFGGGRETTQGEAAATGSEIVMQNLAYGTTTLEIQRGTTVTWINRDNVQHTVTSDDGTFDSGLVDGGARWSHTFNEAGSFPYHCTPHPFMRARIIVR